MNAAAANQVTVNYLRAGHGDEAAGKSLARIKKMELYSLILTDPKITRVYVLCMKIEIDEDWPLAR